MASFKLCAILLVALCGEIALRVTLTSFARDPRSLLTRPHGPGSFSRRLCTSPDHYQWPLTPAVSGRTRGRRRRRRASPRPPAATPRWALGGGEGVSKPCTGRQSHPSLVVSTPCLPSDLARGPAPYPGPAPRALTPRPHDCTPPHPTPRPRPRPRPRRSPRASAAATPTPPPRPSPAPAPAPAARRPSARCAREPCPRAVCALTRASPRARAPALRARWPRRRALSATHKTLLPYLQGRSHGPGGRSRPCRPPGLLYRRPSARASKHIVDDSRPAPRAPVAPLLPPPLPSSGAGPDRRAGRRTVQRCRPGEGDAPFLAMPHPLLLAGHSAACHMHILLPHAKSAAHVVVHAKTAAMLFLCVPYPIRPSLAPNANQPPRPFPHPVT